MKVTENTKLGNNELQYLKDAAVFNHRHKNELEKSTLAGCYYCCTIFPTSDIKEWVRSYRRKGEIPDCALCPKCGIDAVLPDAKVVLSIELLKKMKNYWFAIDD